MTEPTPESKFPKIYGQRILAQGAMIWEWARSKLDGRPNAWLALGDDFDHKTLIENTELKCGLRNSCYQESLLQKKICKFMAKNLNIFSTLCKTFQTFLINVLKLYFF